MCPSFCLLFPGIIEKCMFDSTAYAGKGPTRSIGSVFERSNCVWYSVVISALNIFGGISASTTKLMRYCDV